MADRTSRTEFYPAEDPTVIMGKTNASNNDTFSLDSGNIDVCLINAEDDIDAIATAAPTTTGCSEITIGLTDDAGSAIDTDTDLNFMIKIKTQ
jgi:hypothetical protein